jgi:hypothetical protein
MNKRKTFCDPSKLLVATLFRLETEIQEAMLRPERRVPTKVIHESVEEEPVWLGHSYVGSIKEGMD